MEFNTPQDSSQIDTFLTSPDDDSISADSIIPNNQNETTRDGRLQSLRQLRIKTLSEVESFFTYYEKLINGEQSRLECSSDVEILLRKLCIKSFGFVTPKLVTREIIYKFLDLIPLVISQSERESALSMWEKGPRGYNISTRHPLFTKICSITLNATTKIDSSYKYDPFSLELAIIVSFRNKKNKRNLMKYFKVVPITEIDANSIMNSEYDDIFKYRYRALPVVEDIFGLKQDQKKFFVSCIAKCSFYWIYADFF
ncbi:hypothetical protein WA158_003353 [Blastocystis sp. Blastoise]